MLKFGIVTLVTSVLTIAGISVVLVVVNWQLALPVLLALPILWLLTRWFRNQSERAYRETRDAIALVIVHFVESLGGIQAVHAFRREPRNQEIYEHLDDRYRRANVWSQRLAAAYGPGVQLVGRMTTAVVVFYGGWLAIDGRVSVGVLAAFLLYLRRFFEPMQELSQFYNLFQAAVAGLEKLSGVLEEPLTVAPPAHPVPLAQAVGRLHFDTVDFAYRERPVLTDLELRIPGGQTIAVVGATGAGKTTIARLAARFWDPSAGRVTLDGIDLRELDPADLHRAIVTVTQENFLFSGSVADNVGLGRPTATRAEIEQAARAIGAHEFISALPDGYDTDVHQKGARLSAGQRQLVAFARAFLADPAVLILDEATSSLDIPSERLVQRALRTLLADRTAIIIAHRLTTVEIADRVLVLEAGRIVEDGAPADLIGRGGKYAGLHQAWLDSLV
jgi:ABC-type multidrug transport system fused ATPase/permease subunit